MNRISIGSCGRFLILFLCALLAVAATTAQGQTGEVRGTVLNAATKEPLIDANVIVQGTMKGAATDFEGAFAIKGLNPGKYVLVVRFLGYFSEHQNIEIIAGQVIEANFLLRQDVLKTDEVVITGLSGAIPRGQLGNSIAKVAGSELQSVPVTSALDALVGKVAGMSVSKSTGTPGTGTYITIRGRRTVNGSSQPLYVIDGVPLDDSYIYNGDGAIQGANRGSDINPNDIESIEVLKGASAAAIYGSRAANGVILITTKSGQQAEGGKFAKVSYSTSYSIDEVPNGIPLQTSYGQIPGTNYSYGDLLAPGTQTYDHSMDIFKVGHNFENSISVSGGIPTLKYLASGTFTNQTGVVRKSDFIRQNLRMNLNYSPFSNFGVKSNTNIINQLVHLPQDGSNTSGILLGGLRTPPEFNNMIYLKADGITQNQFGYYDNPIWTMENNIYKSEMTRVIHTTGFDYDFMEGMRLSGNVGWDRYNLFNSQRLAVGNATNGYGSVTQDRYTNDVVNTDIMWTGKFNLTDDILSTFIVGQQLTFTVRNETGAYSENTLPRFDEIGSGVYKDATSARYEDRIYSYYVQGMFNAWDRLTLTGAVRRDAGSTFGSSNPVYYYPKASVAYRISEESFMQDIKGTIDELKLRLAWGKAGRIPDRYASNRVYVTDGYWDPWDRSTSASRAGQLGIINYSVDGTENIKPEQTEEIETGLDASFLDHRISLEFNYYKQYVTQLLLYVKVPTSTGWNQQYRNAGDMWNQGIEVQLKVNPLRSKDFNWVITANYARNKNEVTKLEGFANSYTEIGGFAGTYNVAKVGKPLGLWMGAGYRHDANGKVIYSDPADPNRQENLMGYDDNGDPSNIKGAPLYSDKLEEFGKSDPDWTGSLRNDFTLLDGDLTASILFEAAIGQKVWNGTKGALYNYGTSGDTEDRDMLWFNDAGQPVTYEGTNTISIDRTYQPGEQLRRGAYYQLYGNGFVVNEPQIEDGSYVKLREISISYRWRNPLIGLESIVFSVSGRNLKTWTNYTGYDPEVNTFAQAESRGFDYFTLPQIRSYRFDITINY